MKTAILLTLISLGTFTIHGYSQLKMDVSQNSTIEWTGRPLVGDGHKGTIKIASGFITLSEAEQNKFDKGVIIIDMNSIQNTDMPANDGGTDLVNHLKSEDFFSVKQFPYATLEITSMVPLFPFFQVHKYSVTGNLTIKGVTHTIIFPAIFRDSDKGPQFEGTITIDRTRWGINYKSQSIISTVKDGIIANEINITFKLMFNGC